jgi:hypothetical protein
VNNHPSTFALSFDPKSVPNTSLILYEIAVLFTAIAVFYTAQLAEVNSSFQIFAPNIEYVLIKMSDNGKVKNFCQVMIMVRCLVRLLSEQRSYSQL